jgi:hypothetical protein
VRLRAWVALGQVGNCQEDPSSLKAMAKASRSPGLIQRYREELQVRHYARRTVNTYEQWLRRFLRFHRMRHPRQMGEAEINAFPSVPSRRFESRVVGAFQGSSQPWRSR